MGCTFLIDSNLPINTEDEKVAKVLRDFNVTYHETTDLPLIGREIRAHKPDIAYIPSADWHRSLRDGDRHYSGLVIPTSKFTGKTDLPSVLVVRRDDPATSLVDLRGASYGYINKSCTSSYFPPIVMLHRKGMCADEFLDMRPVKAWQGQIDAVVDGEVRATMVPEDTWRILGANAETTKIIDRFEEGKPGIVVARCDLDQKLRAELTDALVEWTPSSCSIYSRFKPFQQEDTESLFRQLDQLPPGS
ncbi:hypothetical protein PFICI_03974 [Pestalotiopsis fici W106-1]|uniref:SsuA/THI5-like domain-containing protein n=1 Tax=Pestalotiopsis fici (strain W106-1 / CGMCC3.15140) TaxID=1229662 RepID=W3XIW0_PESFW|nr:uncharacterized protein PFICI_03974 [Pestalotiopsis fici W106-1]ETS85949.1 hypothetical protein PFICI_03974 [Pestalotiopsis fici W106-1]